MWIVLILVILINTLLLAFCVNRRLQLRSVVEVLILSYALALVFYGITGLLLLLFSSFTALSLVIVSVLSIAALVSLISIKRFSFSDVTKLEGSSRDLIFILIIGAISCMMLNTFSEWTVRGEMDAGRYVSIAFSYVGDGAYKEQTIEGSKCNSALVCRDDGSAVTQYLPMYPVMLAYGNLIKGYFGMKVIQITMSFMSAVIFYAILNRMFRKSELIVGLGLMLFVLNAIQLNYSKEFMTEVFAQSLFLLVVWLYLTYKEKRESTLISLAVVLLSILFLTKLDTILLLLIVPAYYLTELLQGKVKRDIFTAILSFISAASFLYFFSQPYINRSIGDRSSGPLPVYLLLAVTFALVIIMALSRFNVLEILRGKYSRFEKYIAIALSAIIVIFSAFICFRTAYTVITATITAENIEAINLIRLNHFYPVFVTVIGIFGLAMYIYKGRRDYIMVFTLGLLALVPILESSHSSPLYWWSRRYLVITIPVTLLAYCYVLYVSRKYKKLSAGLIVLTSLAIFITAYMASPSFGLVQNRGSDEATRSAHVYFEEGSAIVYSSGHAEISYLSPLSHRYNLDGYIIPSLLIEDIEMVEPLTDYRVIYLVNMLDMQDTQKIQISDVEYSLSDCTDIHVSYEQAGFPNLICEDLGLICSWETFISWVDVSNSYKICEYRR